MQVSGPLAGGGAGTSPPRSPGHPPSWGFPTSRLPVAHFLWVESIWDTKAGNVGCHSHAKPSRIKTQLCAGQQVCKLLPPQKFGVALSELYCGVCVIFFWINPSLENSQIGLSRDRVTSVPGTVTRGLGAEDTESTWMSGALTFWKNDLGKQSSPGFPFPFQDAESPAETLPGSGCSLAGLGWAVLCQGRAVRHCREQLSQRPLTLQPSQEEWGRDKGWQSLTCPCQTPEQTPPGGDTNPAEENAGNPRPTGHSWFLLVTHFTPQSEGRLTFLTSPSLTFKR